MEPQWAPWGRVRRSAECVAFVAVWVGLGVVFHLEPNVYLLLGIPLTVLFQLVVRRAPLRALWVWSAPPFRFRWASVVLAVALAAYPVYLLLQALRQGASWVQPAVFVVTAAGAPGAAYAVQHFRRDTLRWLLWCLATAGGTAIIIMLSGALGPLVARPPLDMLEIGGKSLLLFLPIGFVLEEVTFRGALDAHAHHPGEAHGVGSAVFVSALWGLWHYPLAPPGEPLATIGQLLLIHIPVGLFLSLFWRKSGNLLVSHIPHAAIDAVRNAII
jgi:membrane protease YdiL (CAAX protease family)